MNKHPEEPMTPDERALAERLSRLGPHGEPSPALDARILAAAHAAASTRAEGPRPSPRWPLALGIAASLTLAVGIAWQLRPVQESTSYDEAASASVQAEIAAPAQSQASAAEQAQLDAAAPTQPPASTPVRESAKVTAISSPAAPAPPPPQPPPAVRDIPVAPVVEATAPPPAPAAAAAASRAPVPTPAPEAAAAKAASSESRAQAAGRNSADAAAGVATMSRQDAFAEDAAAEDVPPATADSPAVRDAWLQRIRELVMAGNADEARASLREFVHRYPNHPLPDDLRPLLRCTGS
jgi:hypothetical protein